MKTQYTICLFVVVALLSACKTAQRTPPPMPPTASPPTSSSPPSRPSQESSSKPSSPSPSQSPSAQPSMPTQETAQSKPSSSGQPSTSTPAGDTEQQEAATELKQAGQQVADVGAQLPQGDSGSEQPPSSPVSTPGNEEWDPLMLPDEAAASAPQSDAVADAEAGGTESSTAESAAAESVESAAADSGASGSAAADPQPADLAGASSDAGIEDPLMDEIQAAREALQEAGIALETAGGALETATSREELAAAEAALARARVSVIVAGQDLLDLQELATDPHLGEIIEQAKGALNQANSAIVIASDSIFSTRISLPEFEQEQAAGGGGNSNESELDKELSDSIVIFENQILGARNDVIGSAPAPTSAENIPGVAVLGSTLEDETEAGSLEENQETLIIAKESEVTQQGRMPEGAELASVEDKTASLIPDDIPDPQGDDIVAQQLREAAVAETDPALREKLWEEYRRYKAGL